MATTAQFFVEWLGKENDNGTFKGQCVNLLHSYYEEVLGLPRFVGNARDYANETRIPKAAKPQPGDIVIFNYGTDGHCGVCVWSREQDFQCMEQNNPIGSPCHYVYHTDFENIICVLRPNLPENSTPRPEQNPKGTFTINYTAINVEPTLLEQGRQLLKSFSNNQVDCTFEYQQLPQIVPLNKQVFTLEEQIQFIKNFPIKTRFGFVKYFSSMSGFQMTTAEIPQTPNIVTFATENNQDPLYCAYEFVNALYAQALSKGLKVQNDDIFTPSETFVRNKVDNILPFLDKLR